MSTRITRSNDPASGARGAGPRGQLQVIRRDRNAIIAAVLPPFWPNPETLKFCKKVAAPTNERHLQLRRLLLNFPDIAGPDGPP